MMAAVESACRYAAVTPALGERRTLTEDKHHGSRHGGAGFLKDVVIGNARSAERSQA